MKIRTFVIVVLLCTFTIIPQTGCKSEEPVSKNGFYLDTVCSITIYDMEKEEAEAVIAKAFQVCEKYEMMLSKTKEGSDIYKINEADGRAVKVHPQTMRIVKRAIDYGRLSKGMFDITIGAVTALWDFTGDDPKVPDQADLDKAVKTVSYKQIQISGDEIALKNPDAKLDLGAIAKGYIADQMTKSMEALGVESGIINLGGNIVTLGQKEGKPWKIGIERPYSDRTEIIGSVGMKNGTIVTSGIYERKFEIDGMLYHHILDPRTGYPVESSLEAVTIQGRKGMSMDCDALATICLMLGTDKSMKLLQQKEGMEAVFVDKGNGITKTEGIHIKMVE